MPRKRAKLERALKKKGFRQTEKSGHRYFDFYFEGKRTSVSTSVSRGTSYRELSDDLLSKMWKQLHLNSKWELENLVDCPMSQDDLVAVLHQKEAL